MVGLAELHDVAEHVDHAGLAAEVATFEHEAVVLLRQGDDRGRRWVVPEGDAGELAAVARVGLDRVPVEPAELEPRTGVDGDLAEVRERDHGVLPNGRPRRSRAMSAMEGIGNRLDAWR